jgi:Na+-driven multidrug efflux pump
VGIWGIGIPLAYLFGFVFHWGLIGIAAAHNVFSVAGAFILWKRWQRLAGDTKHIINSKSIPNTEKDSF